jgi:beta-glucosidase/6-phospho-beta-glucosidase/beta-galactosidase
MAARLGAPAAHLRGALRVRRASLLCLALVAGCSEDLTFPKGFLFGSAIAGFQVEMGCPTVPAAKCEDRNSDWYTWITKPELLADSGLYLEGDPPTAGPGFYELYQQDLDRAANELHGNALRLSIEWSRLFPTATDGATTFDQLKALASPDALTYYHALFAGMKARGLTPLVTLNHYSLPSWIHDAYACHLDVDTCTNRGWLDHDRILSEMAKYAGFVGQEFGGEVDRYATLNEPLTAVVLPGYLFSSPMRTNPPGAPLKYDDARAAMVAMIEAHARVYDAVHAADTVDADGDGAAAQVGIVYNLQAVAPDNPSDPQDQTATTNLQYLMDQAFLDGVGLGQLDANLDGNPVHRDDLANRLDFLGINYYARTIVQGTPSSFFPKISPLLTFDPLTLSYDYSYPKGIYEVLKFATRYNVPLYITETGVNDPNDDGSGSQWLVQSLTWVKRAIRDGMPVKGYFYWTLMDNYEWNHGMTVKMGLYAVDPTDASKTRRAKQSVATYGSIALDGKISPDLAAKYPAPQ